MALVICGIVFQSCEISHSVPFDFPDYKPELIIHAVASPQSGARVLVKYNQPAGSIRGVVPALPALEVYLLEQGQRIHLFRQDSISIVLDNQYEVETAHFSITSDSLDLRQGVGYSLQVIDQHSMKHYESAEVYLPPTPQVNQLNVDCRSTSDRTCYVSAELGAVDKSISAISITGRYLDTALIDDYYRPLNNRLFNPELIYPDVDSWDNYLAASSFFQSIRPSRDSLDQLYPVRVSIAYLSYDLAQLIREVNGNYAIGEDIFAVLRPLHSNFRNAFGVFGLYNEDVREMEL